MKRLIILIAVLMTANAMTVYAAPADRHSNIKGHCLNVECNGAVITETMDAKHYLTIRFLHKNGGFKEFSGYLRRDPASGQLIITNQIQLPEGIADEFTMVGNSGVCLLYYERLGDWGNEGPLISIECAQPEFSFKADR
jgi:hypothetical protein